MPTPIQGIGLTWDQVKQKLQTEGALNKQYDTDVDGVIDWKSLRIMGVRQEVLQYFDDPKILLATSSMLEVLNSADKIEVASGNISADSQTLTVIGGTATATGTSFIELKLPTRVSKVYIRASVADNGGGKTFLGYRRYSAYECKIVVIIDTDASTEDFILESLSYAGAAYNAVLSTEAVDLVAGTFYTVEAYFEYGTPYVVWRDGELIFKYTGSVSSLVEIESVIFGKIDTSTTAATTGQFRGPVVIIYE